VTQVAHFRAARALDDELGLAVSRDFAAGLSVITGAARDYFLARAFLFWVVRGAFNPLFPGSKADVDQ